MRLAGLLLAGGIFLVGCDGRPVPGAGGSQGATLAEAGATAETDGDPGAGSAGGSACAQAAVASSGSCTQDSDCGSGDFCDEGSCIPSLVGNTCKDDCDCAAGTRCDTHGICVVDGLALGAGQPGDGCNADEDCASQVCTFNRTCR